MREIKETCYRGTRILVGDEKRDLINDMIRILKDLSYEEISIPVIQHQEYFAGKIGAENNSLMYSFKDRGDRDLCLAPEYTAIIQQLSKTVFKHEKDVKLFYVQECFRGERPQAGRYRQFTQLGVEVINPTYDWGLDLLAYELVCNSFGFTNGLFTINRNVTRGLDYYKEGKGFEIVCEKLGAQKQICGGGQYEGGEGFAIGIDRLLLINQ